MNKYFEKNPLVHYTIVLTLVAMACGILIAGINAWTSPIIDQNELDRKLTSYQAVIPAMDDFVILDTTGDPSNIEEKVEALDVNDNVIGYIINIDQTNGYGNMQIVMAIEADGTIMSADFLQLNQTLNLDNTRANLQLYVGTNINTLQNLDFISGATRSLETLTAMMQDIQTAFSHIDIELPVDQSAVRLARYQALLTNTASFIELDLSTDPNSIDVKAELYDDTDVLLGYAIEASTSNSFGDLHTLIITDTDGIVLYAEFINYGNSYFETEMTNALDDLVGESLNDDLTDGFALAAPSSPATVPSMEALISDTSAAFAHIDTEGAGA